MKKRIDELEAENLELKKSAGLVGKPVGPHCLIPNALYEPDTAEEQNDIEIRLQMDIQKVIFFR